MERKIEMIFSQIDVNHSQQRLACIHMPRIFDISTAAQAVFQQSYLVALSLINL